MGRTMVQHCCLMSLAALLLSCEVRDAPRDIPGVRELAVVAREPVPVVEFGTDDLPSEVVVSEEVPDAEPLAEPGGLGAAGPGDDGDVGLMPPPVEVACNGVDEDGDGLDRCAPDLDGDGVPADFDCDDADPTVNPIAPDFYCNGVDENCNGVDECDRDLDGVQDAADPDPDDPDVRPVEDEVMRDVN